MVLKFQGFSSATFTWKAGGSDGPVVAVIKATRSRLK